MHCELNVENRDKKLNFVKINTKLYYNFECKYR